MRPLIAGAALALLTLATGCQTPHQFATPDASWKSQVGQLKFDSDGRTLIGEVVVIRSGRDFQLEFLKGGSFQLLKISASAERARAEGVLARGTWEGTMDKVPRHLRHWLQLPAVFAATDAGRRKWTADTTGNDWAEIEAEAGAVRKIRFGGLSPDQDFVFLFNR